MANRSPKEGRLFKLAKVKHQFEQDMERHGMSKEI
jgi:hypothetical protein